VPRENREPEVEVEAGEKARETAFQNGKKEARTSFFENVWQMKGFKSFVFVSVAGKGVTARIFVSVASAEVSGDELRFHGGAYHIRYMYSRVKR
jgi:hypothetical protein